MTARMASTRKAKMATITEGGAVLEPAEIRVPRHRGREKRSDREVYFSLDEVRLYPINTPQREGTSSKT
jgi:hypothetical protein